MLDGYIDFFMDPSLSECYLQLKEELDKLIQKKVSHSSQLGSLFKGVL
jgi:ATP-dependent RNA helicase DHX36